MPNEDVKEYAAVVEINNVINEEEGRAVLESYSDLIPGVEMGGPVHVKSYITNYGSGDFPPAAGSYGALVQMVTLLDGFSEATYRRIRIWDGSSWSAFYGWERTDDEDNHADTVYGNHTLELDDVDGTVALSNAGVVTVPTNAAVAIPVGAEIDILRKGTGAVTVVAADTTVKLRSPFPVSTLRAQWSKATLHKISTNEWVLSGDIG
jgi:hypothetical protein